VGVALKKGSEAVVTFPDSKGPEVEAFVGAEVATSSVTVLLSGKKTSGSRVASGSASLVVVELSASGELRSAIGVGVGKVNSELSNVTPAPSDSCPPNTSSVGVGASMVDESTSEVSTSTTSAVPVGRSAGSIPAVRVVVASPASAEAMDDETTLVDAAVTCTCALITRKSRVPITKAFMTVKRLSNKGRTVCARNNRRSVCLKE
jgi:hypothetical protein